MLALSGPLANQLAAKAGRGDFKSVQTLHQASLMSALPYAQYGSAANITAFTATAAQVAGANHVTLSLTGALTAGQALTLPTAASIIAAIPNAYVGQTFALRIINQSSGAFAWTVTANTGSTLAGGGVSTIAQNTWRDFVVTLTGPSAVTFTNVGTGLFS